MTRPAYDPLRPPAPRFPAHRFQAAGLSGEAIAAVSAQYEGMDYDQRVHFVRDVTRVPNEELARRYADGTDAGASPAMLTPEELADAHKADALHEAAKAAGLPVSGTKVEVATRLVEAGATGGLPVVTPEQVAADAAAQPAPATPDPQSPPPGAPDAAPAEEPSPAPDSPSAPQAAPEPIPGPDSPAAPADAAPAATAPATAPVADAASAPQSTATPTAQPDATAAPADASGGTSAAPTTPAATADGTATPDGGTA